MQFLLYLLRLLAVSAEGRNRFTEVQCHAVISYEDIAGALASCTRSTSPLVKVRCPCSAVSAFTDPGRPSPFAQAAIVEVFTHTFVDVEARELETMPVSEMWAAFHTLLPEIRAAIANPAAPATAIVMEPIVKCFLAYSLSFDFVGAPCPPACRKASVCTFAPLCPHRSHTLSHSLTHSLT